MKDGLLNNWVVKNLLLACVILLAIVVVASVSLTIFTRHGKEIVVPDFSNMTFTEAQALAASSGVRVVEGDSVYIRHMRKGAVYSQTPKPGSKVKEGRRIILTTNTRVPKKIPMPSLVGFSLQQAKSELQSKGLVLGKLIYVRDIATNNVLHQRYRGVDIQPGTSIRVGSGIDLVLGLNPADGHTYAPKLDGYSYTQALDAIIDASMNVGRLTFDKNIRTYVDTLKAVVYWQNPSASGKSYQMGTEVSLKFKKKQ